MVTPRKATHDDVTGRISPDASRRARERRAFPPVPSLMRRSGLAPGLVLGSALDAIIADPRGGHPVAFFGAAASRAENWLWAASRTRGMIFAAVCAGPAVAAGWAVQRLAGRGRLSRTAITAAAAWTVLGGASLAAEASGMASALEARDLDGARRRLPALCGRDPDAMQPPGLARATIESVAENTCDAVVGPLLWGAMLGVPGLLGYRAVNTLDAMVGYRSPRYARFGWAAARLDDAANLVPARLTALLAVALAPAVGGSSRRALAILRRDGGAHPSPNAGRCEAAFAGALGVRLGGTNTYHGRAEHRPHLGDGPGPTQHDVARAIRLSRLVTVTATLLAALLATAPSPARRLCTRCGRSSARFVGILGSRAREKTSHPRRPATGGLQ